MRIGCSGYSYKHWEGDFYPKNSDLSFYAERFDTVEMNATFYGQPATSVVENWRKSVPNNFKFAWKANKWITHMYKLNDKSQTTLVEMADKYSWLRDKLGPILFQIPPNLHVNETRLQNFLEFLVRNEKYAFEFRHPSWFKDSIFKLLEEYDCSFVISDHRDAPSPFVFTNDMTYIRLHGPDGDYCGSYTEEQLYDISNKVRGQNGYIFFDNDIGCNAPRDALRMRRFFNA